MAAFKSAIVKKTGEVISLPYTDSHEDIIEWIGNLKDDGNIRDWCRVEYTPEDASNFWDVSKYKLRLDDPQPELCDWFNDIKNTVEEKMKTLVQRQIITSKVKSLKHGVYYLGPGAKVACVEFCQIIAAEKAELGAIICCTLGRVSGSSIFSAQQCHFNNNIVKTSIQGLSNCWLYYLDNETVINCIDGACNIYQVSSKAKIKYVRNNNRCDLAVFDLYGEIAKIESGAEVIITNLREGCTIPDNMNMQLVVNDRREGAVGRGIFVSADKWAETNAKIELFKGRIKEMGGKIPRLTKNAKNELVLEAEVNLATTKF
jgi:hypothetical protein